MCSDNRQLSATPKVYSVVALHLQSSILSRQSHSYTQRSTVTREAHGLPRTDHRTPHIGTTLHSFNHMHKLKALPEDERRRRAHPLGAQRLTLCTYYSAPYDYCGSRDAAASRQGSLARPRPSNKADHSPHVSVLLARQTAQIWVLTRRCISPPTVMLSRRSS